MFLAMNALVLLASLFWSILYCYTKVRNKLPDSWVRQLLTVDTGMPGGHLLVTVDFTLSKSVFTAQHVIIDAIMVNFRLLVMSTD